MTDGKGCECFARCEADCVCDADWTPEEVIRLREALKNIKAHCEMEQPHVVIWSIANRALAAKGD